MKSLQRLSFVQGNAPEPNFWQVAADDLPHPQQEQLGRAMAVEAIDYMRTTGFTPLLGWMVKSMGGRLTPIEAGFFHEISRRVVRWKQERGCRMATPFISLQRNEMNETILLRDA